jgi:hypothetical protein
MEITAASSKLFIRLPFYHANLVTYLHHHRAVKITVLPNNYSFFELDYIYLSNPRWGAQLCVSGHYLSPSHHTNRLFGFNVAGRSLCLYISNPGGHFCHKDISQVGEENEKGG